MKFWCPTCQRFDIREAFTRIAESVPSFDGKSESDIYKHSVCRKWVARVKVLIA